MARHVTSLAIWNGIEGIQVLNLFMLLRPLASKCFVHRSGADATCFALKPLGRDGNAPRLAL